MTKTQIEIIAPELGTVSEDEYAAECEHLQDCYTDLEDDTPYCVIVRPARRGQAPGTYVRKPDGNLQILGYPIEIPGDLHDLSEAAWNQYCNTASKNL
jgi:hypothetical protein